MARTDGYLRFEKKSNIIQNNKQVVKICRNIKNINCVVVAWCDDEGGGGIVYCLMRVNILFG